MTNTTQQNAVRIGLIAMAVAALLAGPAHAADVAWGTYLGGIDDDPCYGIAVDSSGNVYAIGWTESPGWVSGGWSTALGAIRDGYVVKLDAAGTHQWSTYLGGMSYEYGYGIAVDASGNVYATGSTSSSDWISGGWDTTLYSIDGYVVKLDTAGTHQWSTYLGGASYGYGIAVDASGNVYATGYTYSSGWVSGGWDTTLDGTNDAYIVKLDSSGAHLWSSYLGGASTEWGRGVALDSSGNVYATGSTESSDWVSGGWDTTFNGARDGYVVKLDTAGVYQWSSYLGGADYETGRGIVVDASGNAYATGYTCSSGWVSGGLDTTLGGYRDGYVVKLDTSGAHQWSSYLGGSNHDEGYGIALDSSGNIYVTGWTFSEAWVSGGWNTTYDGGDAYVVKLDTSGAHQWSSYLGGASWDYGYAIAVDATGNVYATGETNSWGWVSGGWDTVHGDEVYDAFTDGFVVKIVPTPVRPTNPGATAIGLDTITWTWQDNSNDETSFKVYDDPGAGPPVTLQTTTAADVELWPHNGLNVNTQYAFQVAATNANGDSALTPNFTAWTLAAVPVAPMVGIPDFHSLYVAILGFDSNPASTLYAIQVSPAVGGNTWVQADGTVGASAVYNTAIGWFFVFVTGLDDGTTYGFQVTARNGAGVDTAPGPAGYGTTLAGPAITLQPNGGSRYVGDSFTFTVTASGGVAPLHYQWRHDGSDIGGATSTDLALGPLALGDAGDYDCDIHDSGTESVTSDAATLNVADHLAITTQPKGATLRLGDPYTLFVETEGGHLPLTYRWIKNETDIPLATKSSYEIASFAGTDAGAYTVVVHDNSTDEETSDPPALLNLPPMPVTGLTGLAATVLAAGLLGASRLRRRTK